ncbi:MAG: hypothetical protein FJX36_05105 [Alphaproteobacteria bacterium]|nr:hypothetical protein [Alphaproteobacteria bacterium]
MDATVAHPPADTGSGPQHDTERRKVNLLLLYRQGLRHGRPFPALDEVDATAINNLWRFCFVAATASAGWRFDHLGHALRRGYGMDEGTGANGVPPRLRDLLHAPCREALLRRAPLLSDGLTPNALGDELRYRACVCPLSDDGLAISHLLGPVDYVELRREIVQGVRIEIRIG